MGEAVKRERPVIWHCPICTWPATTVEGKRVHLESEHGIFGDTKIVVQNIGDLISGKVHDQ